MSDKTWLPFTEPENDYEWTSVGADMASLALPTEPSRLVITSPDGEQVAYTLPHGVYVAGMEDGRLVVRVDGVEVEPDG